MADIKNKNELKRRIDLFLDGEIDYSINEEFCKETMRMMKEFIGHASHRLDCADSKVKSAQSKLKKCQKTLDNVNEVVADLERRRKEYEAASENESLELPQETYYKGYMRGYEHSKELVQEAMGIKLKELED